MHMYTNTHEHIRNNVVRLQPHFVKRLVREKAAKDRDGAPEAPKMPHSTNDNEAHNAPDGRPVHLARLEEALSNIRKQGSHGKGSAVRSTKPIAEQTWVILVMAAGAAALGAATVLAVMS